MRISIQVFISLFVFSVLSVTDPCNKYTNCQDCLYYSTTCGWCASNGTCLTGNSTGPTYTECKNKNSSLPTVWQWTTSKVTDQIIVPDYLISPSNVTVFLRPGIPLVLPINIHVPFVPPIDFLFLVDASYSMGPLIGTVSANMINITVALKDLVASGGGDQTVQFGLASFLEKPVTPFANYPESYVYKVLSLLTEDSNVTTAALEGLTTSLRRNYDPPEDSIEAMMVAALDRSLNFRDGTFHVVMVVTDAKGHIAGDGKDIGIFTPNNLDGVLDGWPPGSGEDYPSIEGVRKVIFENDLNPLFGIANTWVLPFWEDIVAQWGDFGSAFEFTVNSNVVEAIINGTNKVLSKAFLATQIDTLDRVQRVDPNVGDLKTGSQNVTRNTTINFNITLLADINDINNFGLSSVAVLRYVGFSSILTINIDTAVQCLGCDPSNSSLFVDVCGVCGGNGLSCVGCDGILFSNAVVDECGVCGGNGDTCMGCDNVPNSGVTFDVCGVCNGTNITCVGCDGIPLSGLVFNSCGACGGPRNCDPGIVIAIIALSVFAGIAVVILIIALLVGFCVGVEMAKIDEMMIEEEEALHSNPLYEAAKKKFDNPYYGKQDS